MGIMVYSLFWVMHATLNPNRVHIINRSNWGNPKTSQVPPNTAYNFSPKTETLRFRVLGF